jgi:hypothetical protein
MTVLKSFVMGQGVVLENILNWGPEEVVVVLVVSMDREGKLGEGDSCQVRDGKKEAFFEEAKGAAEFRGLRGRREWTWLSGLRMK